MIRSHSTEENLALKKLEEAEHFFAKDTETIDRLKL